MMNKKMISFSMLIYFNGKEKERSETKFDAQGFALIDNRVSVEKYEISIRKARWIRN